MSNEKWSKFIDILSRKLVSVNSHVSKDQTSLTKTEKDMMKNLINGLNKRVIDVDQQSTIVDVTSAEKTNNRRTLSGEISKGHISNDVYQIKNTEDKLDDDNVGNDFKKSADEELLAKDTATTAADEVCLSTKHDYEGFVHYISSKPVRFRKRKKSKRSSSAMTSGKRDVRNKYLQGISKSSFNPVVLRFAQMINVLGRSNGVDLAIKTIGIPTILENSAVFDVKCPFDNVVDEEALVKTILKKLKS